MKGATETPIEETQATADRRSIPGPVRLSLLGAGLVALWMWRGFGTVLVVLSIVLMIFLHELGHYVMAKRAGMKVTEFFIGFGPRIWSTQRGEVEVGIKAIPAGAYVRVVGMTDADEVDPADEARTYRQAGFWPRIGVAVAGSTMHFILAFVLFFGVFFFAGKPSEELWSAREISQGSAAALAGLQTGDRVVSVDGVAVDTFEAMGTEVRDRPAETVDVVVQRDGKRVTLPVELGSRASIIGTAGEDLSFSQYSGQIRLVSPGTIARQAGLDDDAVVTSINGQSITDLENLGSKIADRVGGTVVLETDANGVVTEHRVDLGTALDTTVAQGFLGVGPEIGRQQLGVPGAVGETVRSFGQLSWGAIRSIGTIFNPVNIAHFAGNVFSGGRAADEQTDSPTDEATARQAYVQDNSARPSSILGIIDIGSDFTQDWATFFAFLAAVNLMIGVLNLIPLLPFDGGHVAVAVYERIRELRAGDGKRYLVDATKLMPMVYAVLIVFATVGLLAVAADITQPLQL